MSKRLFAIIGAVITMLTATSLGPAVSPSAAQNQPQARCWTFNQTGKTLCDTFYNYWKAHGDVAQQGYPITNEFKEVSETDGKIYVVQYFERAVFELHSENKAPFDVLLSLLGTTTYKLRYPKGAQELPPDLRPEAGMTFPETGKTIRGIFLDYWKSHGGLAQQGYPITNLVSEKSETDGKTYTVQYFERAVFELHTENKAPYDVLLSQLGTFQYNRKYGRTSTTTPSTTTPSNIPSDTRTVPAGQWGGQGIGLLIDGKSVTFEYDCAHGMLDMASIPMIPLDASGSFDVKGTHIFEHGVGDQVDVPHQARYTGTVKGNIMTLTVTIANASIVDPNATGEKVLGPFTLTLNTKPVLHKCV